MKIRSGFVSNSSSSSYVVIANSINKVIEDNLQTLFNRFAENIEYENEDKLKVFKDYYSEHMDEFKELLIKQISDFNSKGAYILSSCDYGDNVIKDKFKNTINPNSLFYHRDLKGVIEVAQFEGSSDGDDSTTIMTKDFLESKIKEV